jgi:hypothetical protein
MQVLNRWGVDPNGLAVFGHQPVAKAASVTTAQLDGFAEDVAGDVRKLGSDTPPGTSATQTCTP